MNSYLGHQLADSYMSVDEANAAIAKTLDWNDWRLLGLTDKERCLTMASNTIDAFGNSSRGYWGQVAFLYQRLQFPRLPDLLCPSDNVYDIVHGTTMVTNFKHNIFAPYIVGTATSGTTTTVVDTVLLDLCPDDLWNNATICISDGTNKGDWRFVSDYDNDNTEFTVDIAYSSAIDDTSTYTVIMLPKLFKDAFIAQTIYMMCLNYSGDAIAALHKKFTKQFLRRFVAGDFTLSFTGERPPLLCPETATILNKFLAPPRTGR